MEQYRRSYMMLKNINKHADIIQLKCKNISSTGNKYNKLTKTRQIWGAHCVKCVNV